jgi:hypothetical protein
MDAFRVDARGFAREPSKLRRVGSTLLSVLTMVTVSALSGSLRAEEAAQETGAVSLSPDADADANADAPPAAQTVAAADTAPSKWRVLVGFHFGFAGKLVVDPAAGFQLVNENPPGLEPTMGLQASFDYLLMKYFSLGAELRLGWWKPKGNITLTSQSDPDRSLFVDVDIKPRGRFAFANIPLELYGTMPLGLSGAAVDDTLPLDGGPGFNLGIGAGAIYFLTPRFGFCTELLGVWHWFDGKLAVGTDTDNRAAQLYWMLNLVFAI